MPTIRRHVSEPIELADRRYLSFALRYCVELCRRRWGLIFLVPTYAVATITFVILVPRLAGNATTPWPMVALSMAYGAAISGATLICFIKADGVCTRAALRHIGEDLCEACGYRLAGLNTCPECGAQSLTAIDRKTPIL